jgi:hypothetical protein
MNPNVGGVSSQARMATSSDPKQDSLASRNSRTPRGEPTGHATWVGSGSGSTVGSVNAVGSGVGADVGGTIDGCVVAEGVAVAAGVASAAVLGSLEAGGDADVPGAPHPTTRTRIAGHVDLRCIVVTLRAGKTHGVRPMRRASEIRTSLVDFPIPDEPRSRAAAGTQEESEPWLATIGRQMPGMVEAANAASGTGAARESAG